VPTSSRLVLATHVLAGLALARGTPVSSEALARSVNTNPAFVRRLLGALAKAGLAESQMGPSGGALLARPAEKITLLNVYRAVDDQNLFALHHHGPNPKCPIGRNITPILEAEIAEAANALERSLAGTTIADIASRIEARVGRATLERLLDS
jgi:Rrf2 family protein